MEISSSDLDKSQPNKSVRKRKLLTDPDRIRANCKICKEVGNPENLIRHGIPIKDLAGIVMNGAFEYIYFCSENCRELFK